MVFFSVWFLVQRGKNLVHKQWIRPPQLKREKIQLWCCLVFGKVRLFFLLLLFTVVKSIKKCTSFWIGDSHRWQIKYIVLMLGSHLKIKMPSVRQLHYLTLCVYASLLWISLSHYVPFIQSTWQKSTRIDALITFTVRFPLISPNFTSFFLSTLYKDEFFFLSLIMLWKEKRKKSRQIRWPLLFFLIYFFRLFFLLSFSLSDRAQSVSWPVIQIKGNPKI